MEISTQKDYINYCAKRASLTGETVIWSFLCCIFVSFSVNLILQDPVLYISFPLLWSLLDFFSAKSDLEAGFNDAGITIVFYTFEFFYSVMMQ
jgi:hypothetical protein